MSNLNLSIGKDTRSTSVKGFEPNPEINNGLEIVSIDISSDSYDIDEDSSSEFKGEEGVPVLKVVCENAFRDTDDPKRIYVQTFFPYAPTSKDADIKRIGDSLSQYVKHYLDVLTDNVFEKHDADSVKYATKLAESLTLKFPENAGMEDVKAIWKTFFDNVSAVFNGDEKLGLKPLTVNSKGEPVKLWAKFLLYFKNKPVEKGNKAGFGLYPGEGVIEKFVDGKKPNLKIYIQRGESITPKPLEDTNANVGGTAALPTGGTASMPAGAGGKPSFIKS